MEIAEVIELVRALRELRVREAKVSSDGVHVEVLFADVDDHDRDRREEVVTWAR